MEKINTDFLYLLIRFPFSFSINREAVPVYSTFQTQLDPHDWINHTLRGESEVKLRSVTNPIKRGGKVKSSVKK